MGTSLSDLFLSLFHIDFAEFAGMIETKICRWQSMSFAWEKAGLNTYITMQEISQEMTLRYKKSWYLAQPF